ncbi:hypothetical protein AB0K14_22845 [Actinosynnema sp. NPDC050801]|uniref:hypothetical protein n=1 Tax=unclassified Actinosynnema TaxID=2637065 RepID=UPI0033CA15AB
MTGDGWTNAPVGLGAENRITVAGCRVVLVVVPHVVAGTRLVDLLPLIESDQRVQVLFTVQGSVHGTAEFTHRLGGHVLPWDQATRQRFDLVLAAGFRGVDQVHGPVLVVPHGAGALKSRLRPRRANALAGHGLTREQLIRDGRVVPHALVLSHHDELRVLRESCPEAEPVAVVAGDICLDRMVASVPHRERYRRALGVAPHERLAVISSTWTPHSTFGAHLGLYRRLLDAGHPVAAVLHPNTWSVHGARQVRAWLPDGLIVIPPEEGWRAAIIAADVVIGDHGSCTQYAAALGKRMLLVPLAEGLLREGSPADLTYRGAPLIDPGRPALDEATDVPGLVEAISSRPGEAGAVLRHTMYRLMGLAEPAQPVSLAPVPALRVPK